MTNLLLLLVLALLSGYAAYRYIENQPENVIIKFVIWYVVFTFAIVIWSFKSPVNYFVLLGISTAAIVIGLILFWNVDPAIVDFYLPQPLGYLIGSLFTSKK